MRSGSGRIPCIASKARPFTKYSKFRCFLPETNYPFQIYPFSGCKIPMMQEMSTRVPSCSRLTSSLLSIFLAVYSSTNGQYSLLALGGLNHIFGQVGQEKHIRGSET